MASNYLFSYSGTDGRQLWVLDPTTGTLSELADIYAGQYNFHFSNGGGTYSIAPRLNNSSPQHFTNFGAEVLFAAAGPSTGTELWISDGTQAGTHLLKDIFTGSKTYQSLYSGEPSYNPTTNSPNTHFYTKTVFYSSNPKDLTSLGSEAIFAANDGTYSSGLWATDGTTAGTQRLLGFVNTLGTFPVLNGKAFFNGAPNSQTNAQLWVTDGTASGTQQIIINPSGNAQVGDLTVVGNEVLFNATDGTFTNELWASDGTIAGTHLVANINPANTVATGSSLAPEFITPFGSGKALFIANDGTHGFEPWIFDGTNASLIKDTNLGAGDVFGRYFGTVNWPGFAVFTPAGGQTEAVFTSYTARNGQELWITDGTSAGTKLLDNIEPDTPGAPVGSKPYDFISLGSRVIFSATPSDGRSNTLWVTDGTATGTTQLMTSTGTPLYGIFGRTPLDAKLIGSELYLVATDNISTSGNGSYNLWQTDGTSAGTSMVSSQTISPDINLADSAAPCYLKGTRILTPAGEIAVETLRVGDLVVTFDGTARPIRWIGTRHLTDDHSSWRTALPVMIRAGALADNMPTRDLYVSPDHALYLAGVLIPAQFLVNGRTILRSKRHKAITYFHIELDRHNLLLAEGAPAESYREDGNRGQFDNAPQIPVRTTAENEPYAPLVEDGLLLEEVQGYLSERAELLGHQCTNDPDLRLIADGKVIRPANRKGDPEQNEIFTFDLDTPPKKLSIRSNVSIPAEVIGSDDWRRLGIAFSRIVLRTDGLVLEIGHTAPCLIEGFHPKESSQRWTEGDARLPATLFAPLVGPITIEVHVRETLPYVTGNVGSAIVESAARAARAAQSAAEEADELDTSAATPVSIGAATPLRRISKIGKSAINAR